MKKIILLAALLIVSCQAAVHEEYLRKNPHLDKQTYELIREGKVGMGMKAEHVRISWGEPDHINRTVTRHSVHEQWVYRFTYIYIEDGVVTGWQN